MNFGTGNQLGTPYPLGRGYAPFSVGVGSWFGAFGMQQVLFSWIVVGELQASSEWVGITQMCIMLPSLALLLAGGATADRFDPRALLIRLHAIAAVPVLLLAVASGLGWIRLWVLIAFGLCAGTVSAFAMPARDTLLSRVAGGDMMRAVTGVTAVQFGSQAMGALLAGLARWTGSATMLAVQATIVFVGSVATCWVPAVPPHPGARTPSALREIAHGVAQVARTPRLRAPVALVFGVGVLFVGPFLVVFPLLVRDYYQGGVDRLSVVLMLFPLGTIIGSLALRARGLRRKGRAALLALAAGAATMATIGTQVPFAAMMVLTLVWGLAGSVFINCTRTLYQEAAPARERGRVLAVYQLGFMGGAPVGALLAGFVTAQVGLHGTLLVFAATMTLLVASMAVASQLLRME